MKIGINDLRYGPKYFMVAAFPNQLGNTNGWVEVAYYGGPVAGSFDKAEFNYAGVIVLADESWQQYKPASPLIIKTRDLRDVGILPSNPNSIGGNHNRVYDTWNEACGYLITTTCRAPVALPPDPFTLIPNINVVLGTDGPIIIKKHSDYDDAMKGLFS